MVHSVETMFTLMDKFKVLQDLLDYKPRMLEYHFTDQDLDEHYPGDDFSANSPQPLQLVVHAPEFWDRTLVDLCALDERQRGSSRELMQKTINLTREMAPCFTGRPKVVIHPGAMSLDHPIHDKDRLYENLRRSMLMSGGDASVFFTRPISVAFIIATVLILIVMVAPAVRARRREIAD